MKIIGIKKLNYVNKDGKHIDGVQLYCTYPSKAVDGVAFNKPIYISRACLERCEIPELVVGDEIDILYNGLGWVSQIIAR